MVWWGVGVGREDILAFPIPLFKLLTPHGETIDERGAETVGGFVAFEEDAVGGLEAGC